MKPGNNNNHGQPRRPRRPRREEPLPRDHNQTMSGSTTLETLMRIEERVHGRRRKPGTTSVYYDNTNPEYSWLLAGWLCEERTAPGRKLHRTYYDPYGRPYISKIELIRTWARAGLHVLDP